MRRKIPLCGSAFLLTLSPFVACVGDSAGPPSKLDATPDDAHDANSDADSDAGPRCTTSKPFTNVRELGALNTAGVSNEGARLSPDEKTVYFTRYPTNGGTSGDVYVSTRASAHDEFPVGLPLNGGNTADNDRWPTVTADGLFIYVWNGPKPNTLVASRTTTNDPFSMFAILPMISVAGATANEEPFVMADHSALYFSANTGVGGYDLYRSGRSGTVFQTPVPVAGVNTTDDELFPLLSPDELTLYFARGTGNPTYDIYVARRSSTASGFGAASKVTELNSAFSDFPSWVSADDCEIVWTTAVGADGGVGSGYRILVADRPL